MRLRHAVSVLLGKAMHLERARWKQLDGNKCTCLVVALVLSTEFGE